MPAGSCRRRSAAASTCRPRSQWRKPKRRREAIPASSTTPIPPASHAARSATTGSGSSPGRLQAARGSWPHPGRPRRCVPRSSGQPWTARAAGPSTTFSVKESCSDVWRRGSVSCRQWASATSSWGGRSERRVASATPALPSTARPETSWQSPARRGSSRLPERAPPLGLCFTGTKSFCPAHAVSGAAKPSGGDDLCTCARGTQASSQLREQVAFRRHDELAGRAVPRPGAVAADERRGDAFRLPHDELGRAGQLVSDGDDRRFERTTCGIVGRAQVEERAHPGDSDGDVGRPLPPGAAERIADDDGGSDTEALPERGANPGSRRIGVAGQEHDPAFAGSVRAVDARARAHEAVLGLGDDQLVAAPPYGPRLPQDHREHVVRLLDSTLRLGNDFVRDDENVAFLETARALYGVTNERRKVVPPPHFRDPGQRDDANLAHAPSLDARHHRRARLLLPSRSPPGSAGWISRGDSSFLNMLTTPLVSRIAVCTEARSGKPWRRAMASSSVSVIPALRRARLTGLPSLMSMAGCPSSARSAQGKAYVVRFSPSLIAKRTPAPITAPVTETSFPMMPFWTAFATSRSTTRSSVFVCPSSRLPTTRKATTRNA